MKQGGRLLLAVPAVGAQFVGRQTDGLDHIVQTLEGEGGKLHFLADFLDHFLVFRSIRVGVERELFLKLLFGQIAFQTGYDAAGNQIQLGFGSGICSRAEWAGRPCGYELP